MSRTSAQNLFHSMPVTSFYKLDKMEMRCNGPIQKR